MSVSLNIETLSSHQQQSSLSYKCELFILSRSINLTYKFIYHYGMILPELNENQSCWELTIRMGMNIELNSI